MRSGDPRGDWWAAWRGVRVVPAEDLVLVPVDDEMVVARPGGRAWVLGSLQAALCVDPSGSPELATVVDELQGDGFPADLDARVWVANAARGLWLAGLAAGSPGAERPVPPPPVLAPAAASRRCLPLDAHQVGGSELAGEPRRSGAVFWPAPFSGERCVGAIEVVGGATVEVWTDLDRVATWMGAWRHRAGSGPCAARPLPISTVRVVAVDDDACLVLSPAGVRVCPDGDGLAEAVGAAVVDAAGVGPGGAVRVGDVWMVDTPEGWSVGAAPLGDQPDDAVWVPAAWLDVAGDAVVVADGTAVWGLVAGSVGGRFGSPVAPVWRRRRLARFLTDEVSAHRPSGVAAVFDRLRVTADGSPSVLSGLVGRFVRADRIASAAAVPVAPPAPVPRSVAAFQELGVLTDAGESFKLSSGRLDVARGTWGFTPVGRWDLAARDRFAECLAGFGLPGVVAGAVASLQAHDGRLVVGSEGAAGPGPERRKVYLDVRDPQTWAELVAAIPGLAGLSVPTGWADLDSPGTFPRAVAWKWVGGRAGVVTALYRNTHPDGLTVGEALERVLPGAPRWFEALAHVVEVNRGLASPMSVVDLEIVQDDGRHSIDLGVEDPRPGGFRAGPARLLAGLAGVGGVDAQRWCAVAARRSLFSLVAGLDGAGAPFAGLYVV